MDVSYINTAIIAAVLGFIPILVTALGSVLVGFLGSALVVTDRDITSKIDVATRQGWCSRRAAETMIPADGWHLAWFGSILCVANRVTDPGAGHRPLPSTIWVLYSLNPTVVRAHIAGCNFGGEDRPRAKIVYFEHLLAYDNNKTTVYVNLPHEVKPWQRAVLDKMMQVYALTSPLRRYRNHVSVLIHGPPGSGKSTVCELFAAMLSAANSARPLVVKGFTPTSPGASFGTVVRTNEPLSALDPKIVEIAEYDGAVRRAVQVEARHAAAPPSSREVSAISDSKSGMVSWLDFAETMSHLTMVCTTNCSPGELAALTLAEQPDAAPAPAPVPGTTWADRGGRFDIRAVVDADGGVTITDLTGLTAGDAPRD